MTVWLKLCIPQALRQTWLKRIADSEYFSFWKSYLNYILQNKGRLLLLQCNYDMNQTKISVNFYHELLEWWSNEVEDPENT